ncbi:hypothetical protein AB0K40_18060 [Nonomuraea bangladeshensis]|uniref:Transposase n=1 Tax=Nonomuraea bangladeshensis TaxID=404385 RepID=A0ABV3H4Z7_9ACTN
MSRHTPDGFDSDAQAAWYGGQFKDPAEPKRRGRPRRNPPANVQPLPPAGRPEWGVPIYGKDVRVGDVWVHLHVDHETHRIDRLVPYKGPMREALGAGARTACSGSWEIAVAPYQVVRILPRGGDR